jgi:WIF domain
MTFRFSLVPGLEVELFYVKEGNINYYAMQFVVPVPPNLEDLEFTWQSLIDNPVSGGTCGCQSAHKIEFSFQIDTIILPKCF